jgi:hypothetical protein
MLSPVSDFTFWMRDDLTVWDPWFNKRCSTWNIGCSHSRIGMAGGYEDALDKALCGLGVHVNDYGWT